MGNHSRPKIKKVIATPIVSGKEANPGHSAPTIQTLAHHASFWSAKAPAVAFAPRSQKNQFLLPPSAPTQRRQYRRCPSLGKPTSRTQITSAIRPSRQIEKRLSHILNTRPFQQFSNQLPFRKTSPLCLFVEPSTQLIRKLQRNRVTRFHKCEAPFIQSKR
jgi:hypothetical protein